MKAILCSHGIMPSRNCKECRSEYDHRRYLENRKKVLERVRNYGRINRLKIRQKKKRYSEENPEKVKLQRERYRKKYPLQIKAQNIITRGMRRGKNDFPLAPFCELCPDDDKRTEKLEHAHLDYEYPTIYITACRECHAFADWGIQL